MQINVVVFVEIQKYLLILNSLNEAFLAKLIK